MATTTRLSCLRLDGGLGFEDKLTVLLELRELGFRWFVSHEMRRTPQYGTPLLRGP